MGSGLSEHFKANLIYFSRLLNKDFSNKNVMFDSSDLEKVKEAYAKAHHIREYEINLFWSRLNYLWLINAVLFSAWGAILYNLINIKSITAIQYTALFLLSLFGSAFTFLVFSITKAGKHWQQVWEYHVRILEPFVSGSLYGMDFFPSNPKPSISKSIDSFISLTMVIWLASAVLSVVLPVFHSKFVLIYEVLAILPILLVIYFIDKNIRKPSKDSIKIK